METLLPNPKSNGVVYLLNHAAGIQLSECKKTASNSNTYRTCEGNLTDQT